MLARAAVIWVLDRGWIICFKNGSLAWLLSGRPQFLVVQHLRVSLTWWLVSARRKRDSHVALYELASETACHHFRLILLVIVTQTMI